MFPEESIWAGGDSRDPRQDIKFPGTEVTAVQQLLTETRTGTADRRHCNLDCALCIVKQWKINVVIG